MMVVEADHGRGGPRLRGVHLPMVRGGSRPGGLIARAPAPYNPRGAALPATVRRPRCEAILRVTRRQRPSAPGQLADRSVRALLDDLASSAPIPGGGSAAALAGAMGAGLVAMVAALTVGPRRIRGQRARWRARSASRRPRFATSWSISPSETRTPTRRSSAPVACRAARRRSGRRARPLWLGPPCGSGRGSPGTARVAWHVLELAARIAPIGNRNAASDAGVAAQLASAAVRGAILNVRINLPYLPADSALRADAPAELERLEADARSREAATLADVASRLG